MPNERYIGDGVYAIWNDSSWVNPNQIKLTKQEWSGDDLKRIDSICLEPEVLSALIEFVCDLGLPWYRIVQGAAAAAALKNEALIDEEVRIREKGDRRADEEYAQAEEDAQRKRDAAEGFDD